MNKITQFWFWFDNEATANIRFLTFFFMIAIPWGIGLEHFPITTGVYILILVLSRWYATEKLKR